MFVDPAANLYFGNGFTSSTWFAQTKDKFWAGYPPLHSALLYLWMQLFGFGIYTARSLNCILTVFCAVMLWLAVIRLRIVTSARDRLILITLLLLELGYISNSEPGRPDILAASLAIAALLVCSVQFALLRYILLSCLCIFFPLAGLPLFAYAVLLCGLLLIYLRKRFLKEFIAIIIGLFLGFLFIYILYSFNGVWDDFILSIKTNPTILNFSQRDKIGGLFGNQILQLLVVLIFSQAIYKSIKGRFDWFSNLSFGLISTFCIPLGMRLAGAFQFSYSWMLVVPLAICVCSNLDELLRSNLARRLSLPVLATLLTLCVITSPYLNFIDLVLNWKSSDYQYVEALVQDNTKVNEWVFSDSISYFAAKKRGRIVFWKPYLNVISSQDSEKISDLIIRPQDFSELQGKLGGKWYKYGESLTIKYRKDIVELGIYKRK
jgi:hypothetical protein